MRSFLAKLCRKNSIGKRIGSMALALLMVLTTLQVLPAGILTAHAASYSGITLHFDNANGWGNVNAYVWEEGQPGTISSGWPGNAITDTDSDGWFDYEVPAFDLVGSDLYMIFNNGSRQTGNLKFTLTAQTTDLLRCRIRQYICLKFRCIWKAVTDG